MAASPEPWLRRGEFERGGTEELEVLGPAVGFGEARDHHEGGPRVSLKELGDGEGTRGAGEAGDAQTGISLGEGFRQRFECRPLSQHRTNALPYHGTRGGLEGTLP